MFLHKNTRGKKLYLIFGVVMIAPTIMVAGALSGSDHVDASIDVHTQSLLYQIKVIAAETSSESKVASGDIIKDTQNLSAVTLIQGAELGEHTKEPSEFSMRSEPIDPLMRRMVKRSGLIGTIYDKDG